MNDYRQRLAAAMLDHNYEPDEITKSARHDGFVFPAVDRMLAVRDEKLAAARAEHAHLRAKVRALADHLDAIPGATPFDASQVGAALDALLKGDSVLQPLGLEDPAETPHHYLSTACHHGQCESCRKVCKFCPEKCVCGCHSGTKVEPLRLKLADHGTVHATRANGARLRMNAIWLLANNPEAVALVLDFEGVKAVTVSWADEMVASLIRKQDDRRILLAGMTDDVTENIDVALVRRGLNLEGRQA